MQRKGEATMWASFRRHRPPNSSIDAEGVMRAGFLPLCLGTGV